MTLKRLLSLATASCLCISIGCFAQDGSPSSQIDKKAKEASFRIHSQPSGKNANEIMIVNYAHRGLHAEGLFYDGTWGQTDIAAVDYRGVPGAAYIDLNADPYLPRLIIYKEGRVIFDGIRYPHQTLTCDDSNTCR